jgi:hypothetical protein
VIDATRHTGSANLLSRKFASCNDWASESTNRPVLDKDRMPYSSALVVFVTV